MNTGIATRTRRSLSVTIVGIATLLLGAAYLLLGTVFVYSGVHGASTLPEDDAAPNWAPVLKMISAVVAFVGGLFIVPGVLGVAGGLGVLFRKQWGRVVTFLVAAVAILWGVAFVALSDPGGMLIALGLIQIVYGVVAFVLVIRRGGEFRRDVTEWTSAD
jgi:hypothetical protein